MKCEDCDGKGWYVDFQYRKTCPSCDGTGEMDPEKIEGAEASLNNIDLELDLDGVPKYIEPDDTLPMLFMPDIDLPDDGDMI